jgi:uncharacterized protein with PIN domain
VRCTGCGRVYWKGAHYQRMAGLVQRLLAQGPRPETPPAAAPPGGRDGD